MKKMAAAPMMSKAKAYNAFGSADLFAAEDLRNQVVNK